MRGYFYGMEVIVTPKLAGTVVCVIALLIGSPSWAQDAVIKIASDVPYKDPTSVATNITNECVNLGTSFGKFLNEYATQYDVATELVDTVDPKAGGRVLVVEITSVTSAGNAFIGHRKSMSAKAELFVNGTSAGFTNFTRDSMGGFFGGYKGSCSVLARCTKALGNDIAGWLRDCQ